MFAMHLVELTRYFELKNCHFAMSAMHIVELTRYSVAGCLTRKNWSDDTF
jgi:hypothetical protein